MKRWRPLGKSRVAMGEGTISINSSGMQPLEKSYSVNLSDVECILCCRKKITDIFQCRKISNLQYMVKRKPTQYIG